MKTQKTYQPRVGELPSNWYIVDATGQTLGRLAANVARVLRGKHRPTYAQHVNTGEHVIVINSRLIHVTGNKREKKIYDRYSGFPGGRSERSFEQALDRDPTFPITHAVKGMLQHNTLGADMLKRLRVYAGSEHRHEAQNPKLITFGPLGEIKVGSSSN